MYFLEELNKNEYQYVSNAKSFVTNSIAKFFGDAYNQQINERLGHCDIIFLDRKKRDYYSAKYFIMTELENILNDFYNNFKYYFCVDKENFAERFKVAEFQKMLKDTTTSYKRVKTDIKNGLFDSWFGLCFKPEVKKNKQSAYNLFLNMQTYWLKYCDKKYDSLIKEQTENEKIKLAQAYATNEIQDNPYCKKLEEKDILDLYKEKIFNFINDKIENGISAVCQFAIIDDHAHCLCNYPKPNKLATSTFVHELLHASSTKIFMENDNHIFKSGLLCSNLDNLSDENYCSIIALNEILTEYFNCKIIKDQKVKDLFFSYYGKTLYNSAFCVCEPFFEKYFDKLKYFYIEGSQKELLDYFGKENILKIDEIVSTLMECAGDYGFDIYRVSSFNEGLENSKKPERCTSFSCQYTYYKCFKQMDEVIKNIGKKLNTNNNFEEKNF